jgi:hypothetical protein
LLCIDVSRSLAFSMRGNSRDSVSVASRLV